MQALSFANPPQAILCLGAHSDDIEIGCGGTLLRLLHMFTDIEIYWVVFGARDKREKRRNAVPKPS